MQNVPNIVRERLKVATPVSHPDADTLTAFSERLLPEAERARILAHLAHCGDCREVVALALPETETLQPVLGNSGSRWLAWPTLRWGFVAAGIAIISVGVVEYQHHARSPAMMAYQASTGQQQERAKSTQTLPAATTQQPARDRDKVTAALVATNEAVPAEPSPEKARTSVSRRNQFHGSGYGMTLGGPVSSNQAPAQWQQQNAQNQLAVSTPSENATTATGEVSGAAPSTSPQAAQFSAQLAKNQPAPALSGGGAGFAVDKAKLPVPPASPADGMLKHQSQQDQFRKLSPQPVPGEIGGYVVDPSGAVVSNARITITPSQTGGTATAVTNSQGSWLIAGLPSGSYKAQAEAPGFKTTILDLNYDANQPAMFSFTLSPGSVSETVEVSSAQMQVQTEGTSIAAPVTALAVSPSPARALNFEQATNLSPVPRWSINAAGALQRSFDQGSTWQDVNVAGASAWAGNLDVAADNASAKDAKVARAKIKSAGKKDASSPVFRAVIANGADVWAGGLHGSLYHSTDSGNHWMQIVPSAAGSVLTGDIVSIEFPDPQHGKLSTSTAETWITADSGQTWQKQ